MEILNKNTYIETAPDKKQAIDQLALPEKVLQFGTGVLLRALPDYYIEHANQNGRFNGRVVMVKSTPTPVESVYIDQDCLFTQVIRGIEDGSSVEEFILNTSVSRCLHANEHWTEVMQFATSPHLEVVISNTTEVGIVYKEEKITGHCPDSFPAKLLAVLYRRFEFYDGDMNKGLVILPTELIDKNAEQLQMIVNQLAVFNQFSEAFVFWLNQANDFCNTLVDRIVPGKLSDSSKQEIELRLGYCDELMIMSEPFALWAIESESSRVSDRLSFINPDKGCILVNDLHIYKELKLRLLNATHSFACAYAIRSGFTYVRESMQNEICRTFIIGLINEIKAVLQSDSSITKDMADHFGNAVIDRFSNPYIDHKWESISLHYRTKIEVRCIPLIKKAVAMGNGTYQNMLKGLTEFNLFSHGELNHFLETELHGKE
jgi:tagaturonate reductase